MRRAVVSFDKSVLPAIDAGCSVKDRAAARAFRAALADILRRLDGEGLDSPASLSAMLEELAESVAGWKGGVALETAAVMAIVALLNEFAATAWALEFQLRRSTGLTTADDLGALKIAHCLVRDLAQGGAA